MATAAQRDFARNIYAAAQQATDIAPEFVTAQAILESGWGMSRIGNFNLFGITKGTNWTGKTILVLTHEYFFTPNRTFLPPSIDFLRTSIPLRTASVSTPASFRSRAFLMRGPTARTPKISPVVSVIIRAASMQPRPTISVRCSCSLPTFVNL